MNGKPRKWELETCQSKSMARDTFRKRGKRRRLQLIGTEYVGRRGIYWLGNLEYKYKKKRGSGRSTK